MAGLTAGWQRGVKLASQASQEASRVRVVESVWPRQVAAKAAMERVVGVMGNRDLEPFIPALVSCIVRPTEVPDIVGKLSATTFVQTIEAPALAVMVPLLVRPHRRWG